MAAVLLAAFSALDLQGAAETAFAWIDRQGWMAAVWFAALYIAAPVFFIPVTPLTIGAGILFDFRVAFVLVSVSATVSAVTTFLMGRYLFRKRVRVLAARNEHLCALDRTLDGDGWKIVALSRFSPVIPFALLNYFYGSTRIGLGPYAGATWAAMLPGTAVYVLLGSAAGRLRDGEMTAPEWALWGFGILATGILLVYSTRRAKSELDQKSGRGGKDSGRAKRGTSRAAA